MFQERYSKFFKDLVAAKDNAHVKQSDLVGKPNPRHWSSPIQSNAEGALF